MVTPQQGSRRNPAERLRWEEEKQGSGRSFCREAETELSGLCDDGMQEQGVSKILTINLNDMEKELKIK